MQNKPQRNPSAALWKPSETRIKNSNLRKFTNYLARKKELTFESYNDLYNWSIDFNEKFWSEFWTFADIISSEKYKRVANKAVPNYIKIPRPEWFPGAKLNFAENLLRYRDEHNALIIHSENKPIRYVTYRELYIKVAKLQKYLISIGIKQNDKVAGLVTNSEEAIICMLATTSLGAIWTSTSPDFGYQGIYDRFGQVEPKVVFAVNAYSYSGKIFDCFDKINEAVKKIKSVAKLVFIENIDFNTFNSKLNEIEFSKLDYNLINKSTAPSLVIENDSNENKETNNENQLEYIRFNDIFINNNFEYTQEMYFEQLPFDHPLYIMYSSGTTGAPKCIVHGAGGTLIQHAKELMLHTDLTRNDVIFYFTTCGWMMWNWLVSSLFVGSTIYLYDGNPAYPDIKMLWESIDKFGITVFGTSPKYLSAVQKSDFIPKDNLKLTTLKTILSTGSPLTSENFLWVYDNVKEDVQLSSIAGGTDIISCFMLGNPILPVYNEEIQCRGLGMKVQSFEEDGTISENDKGELVCTLPFPSMPIYFLNDPDNKKYYTSYFDTFRGIWRHGDFIKITRNGGVIVYGRSDATLNPGGIRIGTAEIYRIVEGFSEVTDSLVVGKQENGDVKVILFVVVKSPYTLDDELSSKIKNKIRTEATSRHVPAKIVQVTEIPVTMSGKKVEIAVTRIIHNEPITNLSAIANPESLNQFKGLDL